MDTAHPGVEVRRRRTAHPTAVVVAIGLAMSAAFGLGRITPHAPATTPRAPVVRRVVVGVDPMIRPAGPHTVKADPTSTARERSTHHRVKWG